MSQSRSGRRRVGATVARVAASVLALSALVSFTPHDVSNAPQEGSVVPLSLAASSPFLGHVGTSLRPGVVGGLWIAIGDTPSKAELVSAAHRYRVVVLNAWETAALALLKKVNPSITVLVYKDLASTRSYAVHNGRDDRLSPTGVGYAEAMPAWFAIDNQGERIEWSPYPAHWQMKVWDEGYQDKWVRNVVAQVSDTRWDGVLADNDMSTLHWYSTKLLAGSSTQAESDVKLRAGLDVLVAKASAGLRQRGKLLVSNLSDGRLDLPRWNFTARNTGAMDENFAHWGTDPSHGFVTDWGRSGWVGQTHELAAPVSLLVTRAAPGNYAARRYGYGSALVRAIGRVAWTAETGDGYAKPDYFAWQGIKLGNPSATGARRVSGIWVRRFANGIVLVNPQEKRAATRIRKGRYCTLGGSRASTVVRIPPHDARLLLSRHSSQASCRS